MLKALQSRYAYMSNQQTVLTVLGCAGSLAAMLAVSSPAMASPAPTASGVKSGYALPSLTQADSNPITDAIGCTCPSCTMRQQRPIL